MENGKFYLNKHRKQLRDIIGSDFYDTVTFQLYEDFIVDIVNDAQIDAYNEALNDVVNNVKTLDVSSKRDVVDMNSIFKLKKQNIE